MQAVLVGQQVDKPVLDIDRFAFAGVVLHTAAKI